MPTFGSGDTFVNLHRDPGAPMTTFAEVEHNSPFRNETDDERRSRLRTVVAASLLGTTVEWYDFFLYATAASLVFNQLFFPNQSSFVGTMLSFATFAVGFLVRPIGGVVFGHIGDRIGRKKTLALTMFIMGIATALMGVLPTAAQIGSLHRFCFCCFVSCRDLLSVVSGPEPFFWRSNTVRRRSAGCSAASRRSDWLSA